MLIDVYKIFRQEGITVNGVIHVGGHRGEEYDGYIDHGITDMVFFEPSKRSYSFMENKIGKGNPRVKLYNFALGSSEGSVKLFASTDHSACSSILEPSYCLEQYPQIIFDTIEDDISMRTLDSFCDSGELNPQDYQFINIDVQGYELEVLKGSSKFLEHAKVILAEVNNREVYKGCPMVGDIDDYLSSYGFVRIAEDWSGVSWGDALYLKR